MFSRRASTDEISARLGALYPGAPDDVADAVAGVHGRPRRGEEHVDPWVHDEVRRAAARAVAASTGLAGEPYPPDGDDGLRMYLPRELEDAAVADVPAQEWERARADAWGDHGEALDGDRELWWAERAAPKVDALLDAWRIPGASGEPG
ncbi:MAG: hypothetical protein U0S36_15000 [Candidatus Nanopelagicales bacterium]